jgi:hypothetical protein
MTVSKLTATLELPVALYNITLPVLRHDLKFGKIVTLRHATGRHCFPDQNSGCKTRLRPGNDGRHESLLDCYFHALACASGTLFRTQSPYIPTQDSSGRSQPCMQLHNVYNVHFAATIQGCLLTLWILTEGIRNERLRDPWTSLVSPGRSALLYAAKLAISLAIYAWQRRRAGAHAYSRFPKEGQDEEQALPNGQDRQTSSGQISPNATSWHSNRPSLRVWTGQSIACICAVAALYVLRDHTVSQAYVFLRSLLTPTQFSAAGRLSDPFAPYLVLPISTLFSIILLSLLFFRTFSALSWHGILLQVSSTPCMCRNS